MGVGRLATHIDMRSDGGGGGGSFRSAHSVVVMIHSSITIRGKRPPHVMSADLGAQRVIGDVVRIPRKGRPQHIGASRVFKFVGESNGVQMCDIQM